MKYICTLFLLVFFCSCNNPPEVDPDPAITLVTYPNPSREQIRIFVKNDTRSQYLLQIFDPNGKIVFEKNVPEGDATNDFVIGLSDYGTGAFHAVLQKGGSVYTKKFMVL